MTALSISMSTLPASVRGASPELRRLIRKRQNSESAKRCRLRRKLEAQREANSQLSTAQQMANLEALVLSLSQQLQETQNAVASLLANPSTPIPVISVPVPVPTVKTNLDSPRSIRFPSPQSAPPPPPPPQRTSSLLHQHDEGAIEFSSTFQELEAVISS